MTKNTVTPDLIGETLDVAGEIGCQPDTDRWLAVDHKGSGEMSVTLWEYDCHLEIDVEVDCRTFRIVEVES